MLSAGRYWRQSISEYCERPKKPARFSAQQLQRKPAQKRWLEQLEQFEHAESIYYEAGAAAEAT